MCILTDGHWQDPEATWEYEYVGIFVELELICTQFPLKYVSLQKETTQPELISKLENDTTFLFEKYSKLKSGILKRFGITKSFVSLFFNTAQFWNGMKLQVQQEAVKMMNEM